ncbi:hypothetical protein ACFLSA_03600 [Bacteroidota bacterium]
MKKYKISRRDFLKANALGVTGTMIGAPLLTSASAGTYEPMKITEPFHGAVLNRRNGKESDNSLKIRVSGVAPIKSEVRVNGKPAQRNGSNYFCEVPIHEKENEITAVSNGILGSQHHSVRVLWDRYSKPRYQFAIDDCNHFLYDIVKNKYKSLFDSPFLSMLKEWNSKYDARFQLNLFYAMESSGRNYGDGSEKSGFDLSKFPDRYKKEWEDNSDWLTLAFHALDESPARPYEYASGSKILADFDKITEQIHRFAGEPSYKLPTNVHYGMVSTEALKALSGRGVKCLGGQFAKNDIGEWQVHYMKDYEQSEYLSRHEALMDYKTGIIFSKMDYIPESTPLEEVIPLFESLAANPDTSEIMDICTHERAYWPGHRLYITDIIQRTDTALRWLTEHGYKPVLLNEGFLGGRV